MQIANIFVKDSELRRLIDRAININEVCDVNPFGVVALIAAYRYGSEWLAQLNEYIRGNYLALKEFISRHLPMLSVVNLEGTYLAWIDCAATGLTSDEIERHLLKEEHVWVNSGTIYGNPGQGFIRVNLATQRSTLLDGLNRVKTAFDTL